MLEPGYQLGGYKILRPLGSGGMADVYEAEDEKLGRHVALKVLPPELARNTQLIARFEKEVRAAAALNHHGIVTVFEVGRHEHYHFYSMRLLTGGDLRHRIERGMNVVEALAILREVSDAFAHAHQRGFVHRDVKPENIMFDEQGYPVLTDFGIAKALDAGQRVTATGVAVGTPRYISPEQARGKTVDARADLYGLGVILHEMLTGTPPYDAEDSLGVIFKHLTEPIPRLPAQHARMQGLLDALMAKDPKDRPASAEQLIQLIDELQPRTLEIGVVTKTQQNPLVSALLTPSPLRTRQQSRIQTDETQIGRPQRTPAPPAAKPSAPPVEPEPSSEFVETARWKPGSKQAKEAEAAAAAAQAAQAAAQQAAETAEAQRRQEEFEARQRQEAAVARRREAEQEALKRAEAEAKQREADAAQRKAEETQRKAEEAERKRQEAAEARQREEEERRLDAEEKRRQKEQEAQRKQAEAERKQQEAEAQRQQREQERALKEAQRAEERAAQAVVKAEQRAARAATLARPGVRRGIVAGMLLLVLIGAGAAMKRPVTEWWQARQEAAEAARQAEAEAERQRAAQEELRRQAEAEVARKRAEQEALDRQAQEEARRRQAQDSDRQRLEAEAAAKQQAAEEQARQQAQAQARRQAEIEAQKKAEAEAAAARKAEADAAAKAKAEEAAKLKAEQQRQAQTEAQKKAEADAAAKKKADAEAAAKKKAQQEAAAREAEAARRRQAEEAARRDAAERERRRQAELEAQRQREEEARRQAETPPPAEEPPENKERTRRPTGF